MKWVNLILFFVLNFTTVQAQNADKIDSLKQLLSQTGQDTNRVNLYYKLGQYYVYSYPDTSLSYTLPGLELARKLNFKKGEINILIMMGEALAIKGNYTNSLELKLHALEEAEKLNDPLLIRRCNFSLGTNYYYSKDYEKSLYYYKKAAAGIEDFKPEKSTFGLLGAVYFHLNKIDSADFYIRKCYQLDLIDQNHWTVPYYYMAAIFDKKGNYEQALNFYRTGNQFAIGALDIFNGYNGLASVFQKTNSQDSAIYYSKKVIVEGSKRSYFSSVLEASMLLTNLYKSIQNTDSAFKYQEVLLAIKDSLFSQEKVKLIQNLSFNEQIRTQEIQQEQEQFKSKLKIYALIVAVIVFLLITFILYRSNLHKQKAYTVLQKQKQEIDTQKAKVEKTLDELKITQSQLIQSEKMASLGELTAGIAHEIQNPLNFVNNFSEVNTELIDEASQAIYVGNKKEAMELLAGLRENEGKIRYHGQRADAIVKSMLQHSHINSGQKELTDINALADEYLRLAYHGLRAKDKDFNASMKTDFDKTIDKVNIISQDIGRVLLNLINNAFYAVSERKKQNVEGYEPTVSVSTKRIDNKVLISVKDNGNGIPQKVQDKIFQPFFTTKPTGQGTGLGLSLAYDIVKAHGGDIKVDSREGVGTEFIVSLPI